MSQIDWSKAPEGATHYDCREHVSPAFMRKNHNGSDWEYFGMRHWIMYGQLSADQEAKLIARPQPWTGEGLPPVGTVCEYTDLHGLKWYGCEIIAYYGGHVWLRTTGAGRDHVKVVGAFRFRPIRTPEQIASDEREKDSFELFSTINWNDAREQWDRMSESRKDDYRKAIDAGYRKFEIVEN